MSAHAFLADWPQGCELLLHLVDHRRYFCAIERVLLLDAAHEQQAIAQDVDAPRNAARELVDGGIGVGANRRVVPPTRGPQTVNDVSLGLQYSITRNTP